MKLVFTTRIKRKAGPEYLVNLPNYLDLEKVEEIAATVAKQIPERVISHCVYGDTTLTVHERNQLDYYGKITVSPKELVVEEF
jgi:hypothetical protein